MAKSQVIEGGNVCWRINDRLGAGGKRQRRFFVSRPEAAARAHVREADVREFGIHFAQLSPDHRAEVVLQLKRLASVGWTLRAAVDFALAHGQSVPWLPLAQVVTDCMAVQDRRRLAAPFAARASLSGTSTQVGSDLELQPAAL